MKKHNKDTCEGCTSTVGEEYCFEDFQEMIDYHKSQRNWFVAKWEDWIYYPFYHNVVNGWWQKIRPGAIKHYYQRAKQGYSYQDVWGMDYYMVETLLPMFETLKNDHMGISMAFYEDDDHDETGHTTDEGDERAEQRRQNVFGEIIYGLKCAKKIHNVDYDYEKDEYEKLNKSVKRSFSLIGEYFFTFWD
ncbi:MAG: hypothetical protein H8E03_01410 [Pelagibacteraceae bacterium]|nr:hypothetical protein [Pelagibacteraceae bacterium]